MLRVFLLWLSLIVALFVIIDQLPAIDVVTQAGKILGISIWAAVATAIQTLFWSGKIQKYRFSLTLLVLSLTSALIVKLLPGYSIKDINLLLMANIFATFASIILAMLLRKKESSTNKVTKRKYK